MQTEIETPVAQRKIIHIDMDAFYASVEMRERPQYKDRPLVVGGSPQSRGVVCAANYEARKYGVHSAMPCARAYQLCPQAVFVRPRFNLYREASAQVREVFELFTDIIQPLSLDEAWLDVTVNKLNNPSATLIAKQIKTKIFDKTGLTCSAGVSFTKMLAKLASDENKPDGLTVITPQLAIEYMLNLKLRRIPGVGNVLEKKLKQHQLVFGRDLLPFTRVELGIKFGNMGGYLYKAIRAQIDNEVKVDSKRKSISVERTFNKDLSFGEEMNLELAHLTEELLRRMSAKKIHGKTLVLKLKFANFEQITRSHTCPQILYDRQQIQSLALTKLEQLDEAYKSRKVRLLGLGIAGLEDQKEAIPKVENISLADHFLKKY